ncbi:Xylogalacturonan beta-1,3-xylosyltransferase [Bertholletia excelsa]
MENGFHFQSLCHVQIRRLLTITGTVVTGAVLFQLFAFPYRNYTSNVSDASKSSVFPMVGNATRLTISNFTSVNNVNNMLYNSTASDFDENAEDEYEMEGRDRDYYFASKFGGKMDSSLAINRDEYAVDDRNAGQTDNNSTREPVIELGLSPMGQAKKHGENSTLEQTQNGSTLIPADEMDNSVKVSPCHNDSQVMANQSNHTNTKLLQTVSATQRNNHLAVDNFYRKKRRIKVTSISHMTLLLLQGYGPSNSKRKRLSSRRDRELQSSRLQIESAPIIRDTPELYASPYRNFSMFKRSYELMESMLKVYIYREGEKPIFHQPKLRGIYASEGWFMKLMEGSKQFVVRDPRKAHLFYLPFGSKNLRIAFQMQAIASWKRLEKYLDKYKGLIAKKYPFWNRTRGADHFLVGCHDWAPRITRDAMGGCIRALCNSNVATGFKIGKDVSLPVTSIWSSEDPQRDLGGKPPLERPILAFFAGSMHGYVRPFLLHYWENKEPDMKISGPLTRDIEGKAKYREFMKSSKYCICVRGYEVHSPRVVEAIWQECVPVIVSDNYVPPFFEVLDWEKFSVFVLEKDIPNLRNILLSIPEEKYLAMQQRVKMVQKHFLWHKNPEKQDLFYMILHSIWYTRIFR